MINFNLINDSTTSDERKEEAKQNFIDKLGAMASEFEERDGFITIDFALPPDNENFLIYTFPDYPVHEFTRRWNEQIVASRKQE